MINWVSLSRNEKHSDERHILQSATFTKTHRAKKTNEKFQISRRSSAEKKSTFSRRYCFRKNLSTISVWTWGCNFDCILMENYNATECGDSNSLQQKSSAFHVFKWQGREVTYCEFLPTLQLATMSSLLRFAKFRRLSINCSRDGGIQFFCCS